MKVMIFPLIQQFDMIQTKFIDDRVEDVPSQGRNQVMQMPKDYHGQPKPFRKLSEINRDKTIQRENPQFVQSKIGHWKLRRLDRDVATERAQFIVHPAKISEDTPNWFKTTQHYFRRDSYNTRNEGKIDINSTTFFGRTRALQQSQQATRPLDSSRNRFYSQIRGEPSVTGKIGARDSSLTGRRWNMMKQEVAGKVGAVEERNFTVRRPLLKVGTRQTDNFINTYSVA